MCKLLKGVFILKFPSLIMGFRKAFNLTWSHQNILASPASSSISEKASSLVKHRNPVIC